MPSFSKDQCVGHGLHNAANTLGILLLLGVLACKFRGIVNQGIEPVLLVLFLLWGQRLVVIGDRHASDRLGGLDVHAGL